MARVILPVGWNCQPSGATPLASLSRFAALPVPCFVYCPSMGITWELVTGKNGTPAASEGILGMQPGMTYKVVSQTNGGLDFGTFQPIQSDNWTIIALSNGQSTDPKGALFSQRANASGIQIDLAINMDTGAVSQPGKFMALARNTTGQGASSTATTYVDGKFHVFGATRAGVSTNPVLWYDGLIAASTPSGSDAGTAISSAQKVRLGNFADYATDATLCCSSNVALVMAFNGVLSDAQMASLGQNPWQIFSNLPRNLWLDSEMLDQPTVKRTQLEIPVPNKAKISYKHSFVGWQQTPIAADNSVSTSPRTFDLAPKSLKNRPLLLHWQQTPLALNNSISTSARQFILPILQRNRGPLHQSWLNNPLADDNFLAVSARTFDLPLVSPRRFAQYVWQLAPLSSDALTFSIPLSAMTTYTNPQLRPANRFIFDATTTPRPDDAIIISPSGGVWRPVFMPRRR